MSKDGAELTPGGRVGVLAFDSLQVDDIPTTPRSVAPPKLATPGFEDELSTRRQSPVESETLRKVAFSSDPAAAPPDPVAPPAPSSSPFYNPALSAAPPTSAEVLAASSARERAAGPRAGSGSSAFGRIYAVTIALVSAVSIGILAQRALSPAPVVPSSPPRAPRALDVPPTGTPPRAIEASAVGALPAVVEPPPAPALAPPPPAPAVAETTSSSSLPPAAVVTAAPPFDVGAALRSASGYLRQGANTKARAVYLRVLDDDPTSSEALTGLALVDRSEGDATGALESFVKALAVNPSYVPAALGAADVQWDSGNRADAVKRYKALRESAPRELLPPRVEERAP